MVVPMYQAEITHKRIRGRVTSLQQLFDAVGQIFATWISYGCYTAWNKESNSAEWRVPLGIQIIPALFLAAFVYTIPESPRWLCDHDQWEQGLQNRARLHAHGDVNDPYVIAEYNLIKEQIQQEHSQPRSSYLDLFRDWPNVRRTILVMAAQGACQMTGVSTIRYFSPEIFAQIGIKTDLTLMLTGVQSIISFFGTSLCISIIESTGRRRLQLSGGILMGCTFAVNTALIKVFPPTSTNLAAHWTFVAMTWFFSFAFFVTAGPLSWALPVEFYSGAGLRAKGAAVGAMYVFYPFDVDKTSRTVIANDCETGRHLPSTPWLVRSPRLLSMQSDGSSISSSPLPTLPMSYFSTVSCLRPRDTIWKIWTSYSTTRTCGCPERRDGSPRLILRSTLSGLLQSRKAWMSQSRNMHETCTRKSHFHCITVAMRMTMASRHGRLARSYWRAIYKIWQIVRLL
jgi:hypothetical protein